MKDWIQKIIAFFKATDKQLHMLAGFAIAAVLYIVVTSVQPWWVGTLMGALFSSACIVVKELFDKQNPEKHKFEVADIIAGELGVLVLILLSLCNLHG